MSLVWPNGSTTEPKCTDNYGPRESMLVAGAWTRPYHTGADHVGIGTVRAIGDGVVIEAGYGGWAGWQVLLYLGLIDGVKTWVRYCHMANSLQVKAGDQVKRGQALGTESDTGQAAGVHLHWEVYRGTVDRGSWDNPGATTDPRAFVRAHLPTSSTSGGSGTIIDLSGDDDMAKNSGIYWTRARDKRVEYMVFNTDSGFRVNWVVKSDNNAIAATLGTGSWANVPEALAAVFIAELDQVQASKGVVVPSKIAVDLDNADVAAIAKALGVNQ